MSNLNNKTVEVDFFYGNSSIIARDSYTHIKFGEELELTLEEIKNLDYRKLKTNKDIQTEINRLLEEKFCEKYNCVRYKG